MQNGTFGLRVDDGVELFVHRWQPDAAPRAVVLLTHGMAEHGGRYARTAQQLTAAGYAVYAADLRGHGRTALSPGDFGYFADRNGWVRIVDDVYAVRRRIAEDHGTLPVFLLGHSLGSRVVQHYLFSHGDSVRGAALSGTGGRDALLATGGLAVVEFERLRLGARGRSRLIQFLTFGRYNRSFEPTRTRFDWLSRDADEVDKYMADPLCGFDMTVQGWKDVLSGIIQSERADNQRRVPRDLPLYIFSGALDPVGEQTRGVRWLIDAYRRAGVHDITHRFYADARHEVLNELNRDEVHRDLIAWLDAHM